MEFVSFALRKLVELLVEEVQHLATARGEMEWLRDEMQKMQLSIKEAEQSNQLADERVKFWVKDIRNAASFAECIVFKYVIESRQVMPELSLLHEIGNDIRKLKKKLEVIGGNVGTYRIPHINVIKNPDINETVEQFRRNARYRKTEEIIGFEEHVKTLTTQLFSVKPELYVVGVVGMGGVGKTTLASQVFRRSDVQKLFPIRVWADLSQNYVQRHGGINNLLLQIAIEVNRWMSTSIFSLLLQFAEWLTHRKTLERMSTDELKEHVRRSLKGKRYLIVMDGMWEEEVWDLINCFLPDESNGSRIVITTRNENVARHPAHRFPPCRLQCLDRVESWKLFTKLMFGNEERLKEDCTGLLEVLAPKLVEKCGGSPLALDYLVKCLAGKDKTRGAWKPVLENEEWLKQGQNCMETLKLSYTCLPFHLRWCFLYLSAFPEDSQIEVERLVKLWIAEGFVGIEDDNINNNVEDIAMSYLGQLKERCLVEVIETTRQQSVNGRVRYCTIHSLHRLLAKAEAKALDFMDFCVKTPINKNAYRLAVLREASSSAEELDLVGAHFSLRTLLDFNREIPSIICKEYSVLKVLDLEGAKISHLPEEIGGMVCLQYLSIKKTPCRELPSSIIKLLSLETLDCRVEGEFSMPKKIWNITTLTHVYGKKLRCDWRIMCAHKLKTLESVFLCRQIEESIKYCMQLRVLHIHIPDQRKGTEINNGFWTDLQDLPALESLYFDLSGYISMNMTCQARKFPKLQSLTLENFEGGEWEVEEGSMSFLETLSLRKCTNLRNLQYGLRGCSELRELNCSDMGQAFQEWYQNDGVVDFNYVTWNIFPPI